MSPSLPPSPPTSKSRGFLLIALLAAASAVAPWLRNHDYLRDFMDYGLVMSAAGRMDAGESPYVDFVTPIQAGFLQLNHLIEKAGGGDYLGLTQGALWSILIGGGCLFVLLRPFLGRGAALAVAWSLCVCAPVQHTILWHNTLGVLTVSLACLAAARLFSEPSGGGAGTWILLAVTLWLGGVNKLNFHLVALAGVAGIAARGTILGISSRKQGLLAIALIFGCGVLAPLGTELGMTGASWSTWRHNVIDLAAGHRAAYLANLGRPEFYLSTLHDYYGPLRFPFIGATIVAVFCFVATMGWPRRTWSDRGFLLLATITAAAATLAALATNQDIAYIALGLAIGLAAALIVAFRISLPGSLRNCLAAALVLGPSLLAWESAWRGQRSQFGHAPESRTVYVDLAAVNPAFEYIDGLHIPPGLARSLTMVAEHMPAADETGRHPVFYAQSLEWLQRVWPAANRPGLPLWMHNNTSYGEAERQLLHRLITPPSPFEAIFDSSRWNFWPAPLDVPINMFCQTRKLGSDIRLRVPYPEVNRQPDDFYTINALGLNVLPALLHFDEGCFYSTRDGQLFLGVPGQRAVLRFDGQAHRMSVRAVMQRLSAPIRREIQASFLIEHRVNDRWERLREEVLTLPAGEPERVEEIVFNGQGHPLRFSASASAPEPNKLIVGWLPPVMRNSAADQNPPPSLARNPLPPRAEPTGFRTALIATDWQPDDVFLRGGRLDQGDWWMENGAQVWLKAEKGLSSFDGEVTLPPQPDGQMPTVRVAWFKGGRLQLMEQITLSSAEPSRTFHSWSSGPGGWLGILVDGGKPTLPVRLRITKTEVRQP